MQARAGVQGNQPMQSRMRMYHQLQPGGMANQMQPWGMSNQTGQGINQMPYGTEVNHQVGNILSYIYKVISIHVNGYLNYIDDL